ncbi:MAG: BlaI/MecI/CopY family transcriptional regulator [Actinobacteria bacterium]|nr:BlaI/MecI/CopY family transcriptional regulator [Actinomycetota bacterium]
MATRGKRQHAVAGLSALEAEILEVAWERGKTSVRDVHEVILKLKYVPYTTVAAVMKNLAAKGILKQTKVGKAFYYAPKVDRLALAKKIVDSVVSKILSGSSVPLVAYLLGGKVSEEELASLKEKLAK